MTYKNTYVKDVENYFLYHVGKGIMLSPKEYELIMKWKSRGVPKEVVFKGISRGIDNYKKKIERSGFPRSLIYCASFIEEEIKNYSYRSQIESAMIELKPNDFIKRVLNRLANLIASEKREMIRRHYIEARKKVSDLISLNDEGIFKMLEEIEEEFYESFFQSLPQSEQERIISKAKEMISKRSRFMTEKAHRESVLAFRNEILARDYELKSIISYN
ncbi:MAG: hypothetical protein ACREOW_01520 [Thermodesulfobacteriota bacterium]